MVVGARAAESRPVESTAADEWTTCGKVRMSGMSTRRPGRPDYNIKFEYVGELEGKQEKPRLDVKIKRN